MAQFIYHESHKICIRIAFTDPEGIESKRKRKRMPFGNFISDTVGLPGIKGM